MGTSYMKTSWHVATAAEAFAAGQLARCGWDVSVQYGANQPEYDLIAASGNAMVKMSVKGSQDGSWGLTQSLLSKGEADYHAAVAKWISRHGAKTIFCLVQFKHVTLEQLPRMYLAAPQEIAEWLLNAANGRGDTVLHEKHVWAPRSRAAGTIDAIPDSWRFTEQRLRELAAKTEQVNHHGL